MTAVRDYSWWKSLFPCRINLFIFSLSYRNIAWSIRVILRVEERSKFPHEIPEAKVYLVFWATSIFPQVHAAAFR